MIWFKFYLSWDDIIQELSDAEAGRFLKALMTFEKTGEIKSLSGTERLMYNVALKQAKLDIDHCAEVSQKRSEARKGAQKTEASNEINQYQLITNDDNSQQMISNDDNSSIELRVKNIDVRSKNEELSATAAPIAPAPAKPTKHRHGEFGHVFLTDDEYQKLQERFLDIEKRIQNLDDYLENNRSKHYANHYLTILKWAEKDAQQKPAQVQPKQQESWLEVAERLAKEMGQ